MLKIGNVNSFLVRAHLSPADFLGFVTAGVQMDLPLNAGERAGLGCGGTPFSNNSLFNITAGGYFISAQ